MHSIVGRLRRQKKARCGHLCDWVKSKTERWWFFTPVGTAYHHLTFTVNRGGLSATKLCAPLRVLKPPSNLEMRITLVFQI